METMRGKTKGSALRRSRSVSRVLYSRKRSDGHSSGTAVARRLKRRYPRTSGGQPSGVLLFGLAPDGVYLAFPVTRKTGELLPHRFTLTPAGETGPGGLFSVALSLGSPPVAVSDHPALRSSDFPPPRSRRKSDHPTDSRSAHSLCSDYRITSPPSMASLARRSASRFFSRPTWATVQDSRRPRRAAAWS